MKSEHFKMEGLHTVKALLRRDDFMAKVDLKDAFFMVPIAPQSRHLLLFKLKEKTYQFNCLPFGLCTAPRVFIHIRDKGSVLIFGRVGELLARTDGSSKFGEDRHALAQHRGDNPNDPRCTSLFTLHHLSSIVLSRASCQQPRRNHMAAGISSR